MLPFDAGPAFAPVDSARVVSHVYSVSLLALAPLGVTALAALLVRRSRAGVRVLVWRAAVAALLALSVAQLVPSRWTAWIVPAALAEPLVALGRVMVSSGGPLPDAVVSDGAGDVLLVARLVATLYWLGVVLAAVPLLRGIVLTRQLVRDARPAPEEATRAALESAGAELGFRRPVRLLVHDGIAVPMTFGLLSPCILLPGDATAWAPAQLRAALLHELAHVGARDVAFALAARLAAVLFWFNPAVWLIGRRLHDECEHAADDRVLSAGVKPSEYGRLLLAVGDRLHAAPRLACTLATRDGLRGRLAAVVQPGRDLRAASRLATAATFTWALVGASAVGAVELAPTRSVLQQLVRDARWESRAYAVVGLAPRPDSLAVARSIAATDPVPQVRAWASYALARRSPARIDVAPSLR